MLLINLVGNRYGRLLVTSRAPNKGTRIAWFCACDCGKECSVSSGGLSGGKTRSCGCLRAETMAANRCTNSRLRHGMSKSTEHKIWTGMNERCTNANSKFFHRYGGRGVSICDRWELFENFFADMGPRPRGKTLDRFPDKNGNYEPTNCRWATPEEQANNTCSNVLITIDGEIKTLSQWSRLHGLDPDIASQRILRDGWAPQDAVTIPSRSLRRDKNFNRDDAYLKVR